MASRHGKTFEKSINLALQGGGAHGASMPEKKNDSSNTREITSVT